MYRLYLQTSAEPVITQAQTSSLKLVDTDIFLDERKKKILCKSADLHVRIAFAICCYSSDVFRFSQKWVPIQKIEPSQYLDNCTYKLHEKNIQLFDGVRPLNPPMLSSVFNLIPGSTTHPSRSPKVHDPTKPSRAKLMCRKFRLFAAWLLANLAIFISAFFVILYSMEWGADVSNAWLLSYVMSFITNAFFADPCKVSTPI